ncbi:MAG: gamma-glutamyltransferase [Acidobacteria bacterium]|nr:gamma-glutamyltransferase [Acidobacteriota bacterium]
MNSLFQTVLGPIRRWALCGAAGVVLFATPLFGQAPPQQRDLAAGDSAQPVWRKEAVRAPKAMVVSDEELASQAGLEILKKGGNAIDAAVAVAFALAVVEPAAGNIGGGGFMLVRLSDGRTSFLDYREVAPADASRNMYVRADGTLDSDMATTGYRSVGVPGTVAGLETALRTYGKLKLAMVMAPAIRLAEEGFPVSEKLAKGLRATHVRLQRFSRSHRIFLKDGSFYAPGETLRQPELAETLRRIARGGAAEFYRGQTARDLAAEMSRMGGLITLEDLANYKPKFREPLHARYTVSGANWEVIGAPPPSSGGIATIEALNILSTVELKSWNEPDTVHWVAEAMRRVFADRATYLGDADFTKVPVRGLTDPRYAEKLRTTINPNHASASTEIRAGDPAPFETVGGSDQGNSSYAAQQWAFEEAGRPGHTTHFSVVDAAGNAVANTFTLENSYGSAVTAPGGFLLNDEMDDFTLHPSQPHPMYKLLPSEANIIVPGKRPLSSMTPTILLRDGQLSFVTGSPGGPRIISATFLTVLQWMRLGADAQAAINAPRIHHQWFPDEIRVEDTFPQALRTVLEQRGHKVVSGSWIGEVNAIGIDPKTGERLGAADPRREGKAVGY